MKPNDLTPNDVTPKDVYKNRRQFLQTSIYAASGLSTFAAYRYFRGLPGGPNDLQIATLKLGNESTTSFQDITHYNNFYEFSTNKESVASAIENWKPSNWALELGGLVENPIQLKMSDLAGLKTEDRIYRFRCVEGWSMVIPWQGIPLSALLEKARPLSKATHVAFETYFRESEMPSARFAGISFPYVEGLRLDEAMHPLTIMATGIYGKNLPNQNGAPLRLVVPWKYGFKNIKSVVKINLTDREPPSTWNIANPDEYGFFSNVNPAVDHPRWSQARERRIGEIALRPTLPFNGYENEVANLYTGMDLRKYF